MKTLLTVMLALMVSSPAFANKNLKVNTEKSSIEWIGKKQSGQHNGHLTIQEGNLEMDGEKIIGGHFIIDLKSITCEDMQGEWADKFVGHLKSNDFLAIEKSATATLKIIKGELKEGSTYMIHAELDFRGVKKEIHFEANIEGSKASAHIDFEQALWGITHAGKADDPIKKHSDIKVSLVLE